MTTPKTLYQTFKGDLAGFCVLASLSLVAGLVINQFRDKPLPLVYASKAERLQGEVQQVATAVTLPPKLAEPQSVDLDGFRKLVETKQAVILDARPEIFHRLGHVPGALSLSREEFKRDYESNRSLLEKDKEEVIAIYCSGGDCEDSNMVANALIQLGYQRVLVFRGGWSAWTGAGLPEQRS